MNVLRYDVGTLPEPTTSASEEDQVNTRLRKCLEWRLVRGKDIQPPSLPKQEFSELFGFKENIISKMYITFFVSCV